MLDLAGNAAPVGFCALRWRTMFSVMTTAPSTMIPKSMAEREQVGRIRMRP